MKAVSAIFTRNLLNFSKDKTRLIFSIVMPFFFMFIFSFAMKSSMTGVAQPMNYLITGIIIMTVFQTSLNNSMDILNDISSGFMKEIMVSPIKRWQISIGQVLSSTIIATVQGIVVTILGFIMGLRMDGLHLIEMLGLMMITGLTFSSLGLFLATVTKSSSSFQVMISVIAMPLTFLSGAYIPTTAMPSFLAPIVYINPLTHITAIFRFITLQMEHFSVAELLNVGVAFKVGSLTITPIFGLLMIILFGAAFFMLCVNKFSKADFSTVKVFKHH